MQKNNFYNRFKHSRYQYVEFAKRTDVLVHKREYLRASDNMEEYAKIAMIRLVNDLLCYVEPGILNGSSAEYAQQIFNSLGDKGEIFVKDVIDGKYFGQVEAMRTTGLRLLGFSPDEPVITEIDSDRLASLGLSSKLPTIEDLKDARIKMELYSCYRRFNKEEIDDNFIGMALDMEEKFLILSHYCPLPLHCDVEALSLKLPILVQTTSDICDSMDAKRRKYGLIGTNKAYVKKLK
jgi:hypothetical protein